MARTEIGTRQVVPVMVAERGLRTIETPVASFHVAGEVLAAIDRAVLGTGRWPEFHLTLTMEVPRGTD